MEGSPKSPEFYLRPVAKVVKTPQPLAEVHATSMKRLSKIEAADDPSDGAGDE
jgi:hypothetical protein